VQVCGILLDPMPPVRFRPLPRRILNHKPMYYHEKPTTTERLEREPLDPEQPMYCPICGGEMTDPDYCECQDEDLIVEDGHEL
jgi:hypothetical protein